MTGFMTQADSDKLNEQLRAEMMAATPARPIHVIATDIRAHWPKPYYGAVPYLTAMYALDTIDSDYGLDSARSIVNYFLANANTFRGEDARRLKAELKALL